MVFIAITLALFSFSTFIGILFYARSNVAYLFGDRWLWQTLYKLLALVMLLTGAEGGMWLAIIPVALANGIGILALGTWLGGKLMDARMLSIVATLDSFASLQK